MGDAASDLRIWTVDVSTFVLWDDGEHGASTLRVLFQDSEERTRIQKYMREIDQIRCLAGKLLVRMILCTLNKDISWSELHFQKTKEGRPYLALSTLDFDYNITHDGDWVAIAFRGLAQHSEGKRLPQETGIDVMELHLPHYEESVHSFVETMDMTMTPAERAWILQETGKVSLLTQTDPPAGLSSDDYCRLQRLYIIWTFKEAFTKSKGLGFGINFEEVEVQHHGDGHVALRSQGQVEEHLHFYEIILPPGRVHVREHGNKGAGRGTGQESLLVALLPKQKEAENSITRMSVADAQQSHLLRMWTMEDLLDAAKREAGR